LGLAVLLFSTQPGQIQEKKWFNLASLTRSIFERFNFLLPTKQKSVGSVFFSLKLARKIFDNLEIQEGNNKTNDPPFFPPCDPGN